MWARSLRFLRGTDVTAQTGEALMTSGGPVARRWTVWGAVVLAVAAGLVTVLGAPAASAPAPVDATWLDTSYGADGLAQVGGGVTGSGAVDAAGRAYVVSASPAAVLHRLTPDGAVDAAFAGGALTLPFANAETLVHPDPGGTVTVLRRVDLGVTVLRYTAAGLPDTGFHGIGAVSLLTAVELRWPAQVIDREGGILLLVSASVGSTSYLVALTDAGALDPTWAPGGETPGILPVPRGIDGIARDGGTVVAVRGGSSLVRYAADGTLDAAFGAVPLGAGSAGVTVWDGAYYVTGPSGIRRVLPSGEIDESFYVEATCDPVFAVGHVYVVCDGAVTRFTASGELDTAYGGGGRLPVPGALLGVQPNGRLLLAVESPTGAVLRLRSTPDGVPVAGAFVPLAAARLLDTRDGTGSPAGAVPAEGLLNLRVAGRGGVPEAGAGAPVG